MVHQKSPTEETWWLTFNPSKYYYNCQPSLLKSQEWSQSTFANRRRLGYLFSFYPLFVPIWVEFNILLLTEVHDVISCSADIFVFLLSTRAGGLGINLTAADTVICLCLILFIFMLLLLWYLPFFEPVVVVVFLGYFLWQWLESHSRPAGRRKLIRIVFTPLSVIRDKSAMFMILSAKILRWRPIETTSLAKQVITRCCTVPKRTQRPNTHPTATVAYSSELTMFESDVGARSGYKRKSSRCLEAIL